MAVTYLENKKMYCANIKGKQFPYSINKYGPLAKLLAEESLKYAKRFKNFIVEKENYAIIRIYNKITDLIYDVKIDKEFVEKVQLAKWYINFPSNAKTFYVASDNFGKLHRFLMDESNPKIQIDHINHDGLDNRLVNLRKVTQSINSKNCTIKSSSKTGINGVHFMKDKNKKYGRWAAVWKDKNGISHKKTFSENKYDNAFELAVECRKQAEKDNDYLV